MKQWYNKAVPVGVAVMVAAAALGLAQEPVPGSAVPPAAPEHVYAPEQEGWVLATLWWLYYVLVWLVALAGVAMAWVLWRAHRRQGGARRFAATDAAGVAVLLLSVAAYFLAYQWHVLLLFPVFCLAYMQPVRAAQAAEPPYMRAANAWVHFAALGYFSLLRSVESGGAPPPAKRWGAKLCAGLLLPVWVAFAPYWLAALCLLGFFRHYLKPR